MEQSEVKSSEQKQAEILENISKQLNEIKSSLKTITFDLKVIYIFLGMILGLVSLIAVIK